MDQEKILKDLNPEQKEAVTYGEGPLLIVAGAGTGKTTVITRRLAWLILSGKIKPDEVLAVTFTEKAAEEMEERLDKLLPYGYVDLWISTFHSFCERVLRNHAIDLGLPINFKLLNQAQQAMLIRQNFNRFELDYYRPRGNPTRFIRELVKHFSRAKDELISPEEYLRYAEEQKLNKDSGLSDELLDQEALRIKEVANAYYTYQQLLFENNALDFGDLINYTIKLFRERPLILKHYQDKFKYILVDEFQDTNWAQYELLRILARPKNNLTVVADDKQAIYRFRGAAYNNVLRFKEDYPEAKVVFLTYNYRSFQEILDLAYRFIQLNFREDINAQSSFQHLLSKDLVAVRGRGAMIEHLHFKTREDEARGVLKKILEIKEKDKSASWSDFAILVRANDQAEIFTQAMRWQDLPHQFLASSGLYTKPVILDILAYLKLLDNYHESTALYRILTSPIFNSAPNRLKNEDLVNLTYWANRKNQSLYETLERAAVVPNLSKDGLNAIQKLLALIQKHTQLSRSQNVGRVVFAFLEESGYLNLLSNQAEKGSREAIENIVWINQFFKKIEEFEMANTDKSVKNFNLNIETAIEAGDNGSLQPDLESGPEAIKVMTVHGAKGLEFKYVFVVNLVDRWFPTIERREAIELPLPLIKEVIPAGDLHLQEERRLFYVAMTRARDGLFFTSAEDYGGLRKKKLSRFLYEIGLVKEEPKLPEEKRRIKAVLPISTAERPVSQFILPSKFSFSQFRAYETCPLQYKFAFILKIPVRGKHTFSYGQSLHNTLYKFFQRVLEKNKISQEHLIKTPKREGSDVKIGVSLDELLEIYEACWIDDWYLDRKHLEEYKALGRKSLKQFYEEIIKEPPRPKYLELDFNFKLKDYTIKGKMDRVDILEDGSLEIVDYKTGGLPDYNEKEKKYILSAEDKEQLLIYQLAAQSIFREKVSRLTYYYLDGALKVSFLGKPEELQTVEEKIIKIIEEIKKSSFPPKPSLMCEHCDFRGICEYRQI
jgi:DNA helicase-2/ATP-dependent DNA helicase PcrA